MMGIISEAAKLSAECWNSLDKEEKERVVYACIKNNANTKSYLHRLMQRHEMKRTWYVKKKKPN